MEAAKRIQGKLGVMIDLHIDSGTCLKIYNVQHTFPVRIPADDQHIRCSESGWSDMAVVHPLLHQDQRLTAITFHLLNDADHKLVIHIRNLIDFFRVKLFRLRPLNPLLQIFPDLIFTDRMAESALFGIHRALIRESLLQPDRRRAMQPLL